MKIVRKKLARQGIVFLIVASFYEKGHFKSANTELNKARRASTNFEGNHNHPCLGRFLYDSDNNLRLLKRSEIFFTTLW